MKFSAVLFATTVAANWSPRHLVARQSSGDCLDPSDDICHGSCIPSGYECCPNGGGCPSSKYCTIGDNGEYGCCTDGEICTGDGGIRTEGGLGGGQFSFSIPSFTYKVPSFTYDMPSYTYSAPKNTFTGSSGGSSDSGSGGSGANDECISLAGQLPPAPTPPPEIMSALENAGGDFCNYKPPKSLSGAYKSWADEQKSWLSENSDIASKVQSACSSGSTNLPGGLNCKGTGGSDSGAGCVKAAMGAVAAGVVVAAAL